MDIIDLFCGMGGWAKGLIDAGHNVTGYDIMDFSAVYPGKFIQVDLLTFNDFPHVDVVVASPPCTEFSKTSLPSTWRSVVLYPPNISSGLKLWNRARKIIDDNIKPEYYILENVRGAQKWVGMAREHKGSRYLWGNYPDFDVLNSKELYGKMHVTSSKNRAILRSIIPYPISRSLGDKLRELELKKHL